MHIYAIFRPSGFNFGLWWFLLMAKPVMRTATIKINSLTTYLTFQTSLTTGMLTCLCFALVWFGFGFVSLWLHFILVSFPFGFISFWSHFILDSFCFGFVSQSTVSQPVLHHACRPDCVVLYNLTSMPVWTEG